jgi:16S rRNA (uracil1498-N3)-methyltransferase
LKGKVVRHHHFFISPGDRSQGGMVRFSKAESRHMLLSLRVRKGDLVAATDGTGVLYRVSVEDTSGRQVTGRIEQSRPVEKAGPPVHLFQAIVKPARMELVVEKATELGMQGFTPVRTARTRGAIGRSRHERLRKAAIEAMKQSLGAYLPEINEPVTMSRALGMLVDFDFVLVAFEGDGVVTLRQALEAYKGGRIALWIGPEGGFTESETAALAGQGAVRFTLGRQRLKSETAAIASLAILHSLII